MKRIVNISLIILLVVSLIVIGLYLNRRYKNVSFQDIEVYIDYRGGDSLIFEEDIRDILHESLDTVIGKRIGDVDLDLVRGVFDLEPSINSVEVYPTLLGDLKVELIQKTPLVRVINGVNKSFYISTEGELIPLQIGNSVRVLVASGYISSKLTKEVLDEPVRLKEYNVQDTVGVLNDIFNLATCIQNDEFFKAQLSQIYVNSDMEYEIVPMLGKHIIKFGSADEIERKFDKLKSFYKQGINTVGWDMYSTLDIRFGDQVVGSK
jgi:cell division protein FtsQ